MNVRQVIPRDAIPSVDAPEFGPEYDGDPDEPAPVEYETVPYQRYFESDGFGLGAHRGTGGREWDRDDIDAKTVVLGIEHHGSAIGFLLPRVEDAGGVVTESVGDLDVLVLADETGFHAFEDPGLEFERTGGELVGNGTKWDPVRVEATMDAS